MGLSFLVTRRALSLGAQDNPVTGWYAKVFTETANYDKCVIVPKGFNMFALGIGSYAKYAVTGYIGASLIEGDEIISNGKYYEVVSVEDVDNGDSHMWYMCELHEVQMHWDTPTYGTGATVNDPRYQTKIWLDAHLTAGNLLKNAGAQALYITCWEGAPYPIKKVFDTKGVDLIFSIGKGEEKSLIDVSTKKPYGYTEKIPIEVCAIDKMGISGENLMWQGERELRRIAETYPTGSLRDVEMMRSTTKQLGSITLHSVECMLNYRRGLT
jgi:hypothetical protein